MEYTKKSEQSATGFKQLKIRVAISVCIALPPHYHALSPRSRRWPSFANSRRQAERTRRQEPECAGRCRDRQHRKDLTGACWAGQGAPSLHGGHGDRAWRVAWPTTGAAHSQMLVDDVGEVTVTNDGATILKLLEVEHPAAKVRHVHASASKQLGAKRPKRPEHVAISIQAGFIKASLNGSMTHSADFSGAG